MKRSRRRKRHLRAAHKLLDEDRRTQEEINWISHKARMKRKPERGGKA